MFLSNASAYSFEAAGSIQVLTNVARFRRALPSSIAWSCTTWYAVSGSIGSAASADLGRSVASPSREERGVVSILLRLGAMILLLGVRVWSAPGEIYHENSPEGVYPMKTAELLADALGRVRGVVHEVTAGLTPDQLAWRPQPTTNSICWLIWHLTRVQDDHVADVAGTEQVWTAEGWADRFALPLDKAATCWGQTPGAVAGVRVESAD